LFSFIIFFQANEEVHFDYKGHWCIEVAQGDVSQICVVDFKTWGGGGNNLLKMA
jgi:hypothetical protein